MTRRKPKNEITDSSEDIVIENTISTDVASEVDLTKAQDDVVIEPIICDHILPRSASKYVPPLR